jgi:hypothetical protein
LATFEATVTWTAKFSKSIVLRDGRKIAALGHANAFMLTLLE